MRAGLVCAALLGALGAAAASAQTPPPCSAEGYEPGLVSAWASSVVELLRGPMDVEQPQDGNASHGSAADAIGPPGPDSASVVSLGDGGQITLHFASGISDGPGDDFAVYENGFFTLDGLYAEFVFVEVSTDNQVFHRFDASCLRTEEVDGATGEVIDPDDYHNLGGKHERMCGTGFDLAELGLGSVEYVRLVDVIGDGSTEDHQGREIYDPFKTPWITGGADIDAVGVLHTPEPGALASRLACGLALWGLARRRRSSPCDRGA